MEKVSFDPGMKNVIISSDFSDNLETFGQKKSASQKTGHSTLTHNFAKCWPIFTILSLQTQHSAVNFCKDLNTSNAWLHYLVKP